jgi:hypothetical protein
MLNRSRLGKDLNSEQETRHASRDTAPPHAYPIRPIPLQIRLTYQKADGERSAYRFDHGRPSWPNPYCSTTTDVPIVVSSLSAALILGDGSGWSFQS